MDGKLTQVIVVVKDQDAALKFYTEKVGLEKKTEYSVPGSPRWVTVALKGQEVELSLFQHGSVTAPDSNTGHLAVGNCSMTITVADCRKTYEELRGRGIQFRAPPSDQPWGTYVAFSDPDGNQFTLLQPKKW
jgi:predicted enzyme related to lactoylglutathione lyase